MQRTRASDWRRGVVLLLFAAALTACAPPRVPDESATPIVVRVDASREWTDTGVRVHKDDWLFLSATGEIYWAAWGAPAGPDGLHGSPGWLKAGGLLGRVSASTKTFEIGARTGPMRSRNLRSQATYPAPPIRMPADGVLTLGFKQFSQGANAGSFEVTIRRAHQP
jgi:hypothetical protein